MFRKIFITAAILVCLVACKSKSAFQFSQDIVKKEKEITDDMKKTAEAVGRLAEAEEYDSLAAVSEKMESLLEIKLQEVKDLPLPEAKDAENFKKAAVDYFAYLKNLFTSYKKYGQASSGEERQEQLKEVLELETRKREVLQDMQRAQKRYADVNGFRLENK